MAVLIDTSFLLAALYSKDQHYKKANETIQLLDAKRCIIPAPTLLELFHMGIARSNYVQAIDMLERIERAKFEIEAVNGMDRVRMLEIMRQYASADFDYADVAIMALSERLNIKQVYTFDHRDFSIFRPKHCPYLEILP